MKKKTIGIAGYGAVGKLMAEFFRSHYKVRVYDPKLTKGSSKIDNVYFVKSLKGLNDCDMTVVCVPTPAKEDGSCDISLVEKTVNALESPLILIKSTVPPGTCKALANETMKNIVFSPSYIGEGSYWSEYKFDKDVKETPFFIFGGQRFLSEMVVDLLAPIVGPNKKYHFTDYDTAELVKYWNNTFLAMKVTFCNEMYDICQAMNISYWEARELWLLDPRVEASHTAVFADKRGFDGKCLPKDTKALRSACRKLTYEPKFIDAMIRRNEDFTTYTAELVPSKVKKDTVSSTLPKGTKIKMM